jgi:phospholipase C
VPHRALYEIPQRTVVNGEFRHTSVIRTLRERWSLGGPLTARDAGAPDIGPVLSLSVPRPPDEWPVVVPRPVPKFDVAVLPPNQPLSVLGKGILHAIREVEKTVAAKVPTIPPDADLTGAQAVAIMRESDFNLFPGLRTKT